VPLVQANWSAAIGKDRVAAFSDGVIAIIITIMVLELKVPHGSSWAVLAGVAPHFFSYVLSFIYLAIYWNNHHHLLHTAAKVDGLILWANSHLLFWLSLIPAATAWMGENLIASIPTAVYGATLLMPSIAYYLLQNAIMHEQGPHSVLKQPTKLCRTQPLQFRSINVREFMNLGSDYRNH
jgi:TMEM175 potassium channel family protein